MFKVASGGTSPPNPDSFPQPATTASPAIRRVTVATRTPGQPLALRHTGTGAYGKPRRQRSREPEDQPTVEREVAGRSVVPGVLGQQRTGAIGPARLRQRDDARDDQSYAIHEVRGVVPA